MRVLVTGGAGLIGSRNEFRVGEIRHCFGDISLAKEVLGYQPQVSFEEGMGELSSWLAGQEATDLVDEATEALAKGGLDRLA